MCRKLKGCYASSYFPLVSDCHPVNTVNWLSCEWNMLYIKKAVAGTHFQGTKFIFGSKILSFSLNLVWQLHTKSTSAKLFLLFEELEASLTRLHCFPCHPWWKQCCVLWTVAVKQQVTHFGLELNIPVLVWALSKAERVSQYHWPKDAKQVKNNECSWKTDVFWLHSSPKIK